MLLSPIFQPFKEGSHDFCLPLPVASAISHHVHSSIASDSRWIDPIWSDSIESQSSYKGPQFDSAKELQWETNVEETSTETLSSVLTEAASTTTCTIGNSDIEDERLSQLFPPLELSNELDMGNLLIKPMDGKGAGSDDSLQLEAPDIRVVIHVDVEGEEEGTRYPCIIPHTRKRKHKMKEIVYRKKRTRKSISLTARSPSPTSLPKHQHFQSPAPSSSSLSSPPSSSPPPSSSQSKALSSLGVSSLPHRLLPPSHKDLPPNIPINEAFPRFYYLYPTGDIYTPTQTRGKSTTKEAKCNLCPTPSWHQMKVSAYWYHMNYYHGISSTLKRPFSPPLDFRTGKAKNERVVGAGTVRLTIVEGLCHQCRKWVALQGVKDMNVKVPEIYWWKHAQKCHRTGLES